MSSIANPPTTKQDDHVRALQRKLRLPNALLDNHCIARFGAAYAALDRRTVSELIDEMIGWESLPADLARAKGQADLPGIAP
jgi:hypothetical protein